MKPLVLLAVTICVALFIAAPIGNAQAPSAKFQIVAIAHQGAASVFKLDTTTGAVSYCFPYGEPQGPAKAVRCVVQDR